MYEISLDTCCWVAQSCGTLCDPVECSLPGCSVPGISKARILEWAAIFFSRGSSWPDPVIKPVSPTSLLDYRQILYCWATREAIRMAKICNADNTKCGRWCETTGTLIHCWLGLQNGAATLEDIWQIFTKLNILLLYNSAIVLISYLLKWVEKLTSTQKSTCVCL